MESMLMGLTVQTIKMAFLISAPMLLAGLIAGLAISIFQTATSINEATLAFLPKIAFTALVMVLTLPWMMNQMIDFTTRIFKMIPQFVF